MEHENGTSAELEPGPFACGYVRARAMCPDGVVRNLHPTTDGIADTFFSVPMYCYAKGKRVYGYMSLDDDGVRFQPYLYRKHAGLVQGVSYTEAVEALYREKGRGGLYGADVKDGRIVRVEETTVMVRTGSGYHCMVQLPTEMEGR